MTNSEELALNIAIEARGNGLKSTPEEFFKKYINHVNILESVIIRLKLKNIKTTSAMLFEKFPQLRGCTERSTRVNPVSDLSYPNEEIFKYLKENHKNPKSKWSPNDEIRWSLPSTTFTNLECVMDLRNIWNHYRKIKGIDPEMDNQIEAQIQEQVPTIYPYLPKEKLPLPEDFYICRKYYGQYNINHLGIRLLESSIRIYNDDYNEIKSILKDRFNNFSTEYPYTEDGYDRFSCGITCSYGVAREINRHRTLMPMNIYILSSDENDNLFFSEDIDFSLLEEKEELLLKFINFKGLSDISTSNWNALDGLYLGNMVFLYFDSININNFLYFLKLRNSPSVFPELRNMIDTFIKYSL